MLRLIIAIFIISPFISSASLQAEQDISEVASQGLEYNWNGPKALKEERKRKEKEKILELYEQHGTNSLYTVNSVLPEESVSSGKKNCITIRTINKKNINDIKNAIKSTVKNQLNAYLCPDFHVGHPIRKIKQNVLVQINQLKNKQANQLKARYYNGNYQLPNTSIIIQPPGRKTKYSIVLMHGLFMTPRQMDATQKLYTWLGFNVINLRLPGHGTKNHKSLKNIQWEDWDKELKQSLKIAQEIGDKVIVSGHSTGGVLAYKAALDYVHSPKDNIAIHGMLNFSPALKTSTYSDALAYFGTIANAVIPNITTHITDMRPEPGVEVNQLGQHLADKYAVKTNQREDNSYDSAEMVDWDKERIKEMYSKLKNMPILQVDTEHDSIINYSENQKVMNFLKKQNNTLHISEDPCLTSLFGNDGVATHMLSTIYFNQGGKIKDLEESHFLCSQKLRGDQLKIFQFIDNNFPGRCDN